MDDERVEAERVEAERTGARVVLDDLLANHFKIRTDGGAMLLARKINDSLGVLPEDVRRDYAGSLRTAGYDF